MDLDTGIYVNIFVVMKSFNLLIFYRILFIITTSFLVVGYTNKNQHSHHIKRSNNNQQNPSSPYNQFYFTNQANSPHNVFSSLLTSPWISPLSIKETCRTASDNRAGMCMPKKACLGSGGYVAGTCGLLGSCCVCKLW